MQVSIEILSFDCNVFGDGLYVPPETTTGSANVPSGFPFVVELLFLGKYFIESSEKIKSIVVVLSTLPTRNSSQIVPHGKTEVSYVKAFTAVDHKIQDLVESSPSCNGASKTIKISPKLFGVRLGAFCFKPNPSSLTVTLFNIVGLAQVLQADSVTSNML